jgi:hypothetical protein
MTKTNEKQNILPKAWLVSWVAYGDEERIFPRHGIKNKVIDVLCPRVKLERLKETAEEYYIHNVLELGERICFQHYTKGAVLRRDFFKRTPTFSSYQSKEYANVAKHSTKATREAWIKYPKYFSIGHNPAIEIREVCNLEWYEDDERKLRLSWEQANADGTRSKEISVYEN